MRFFVLNVGRKQMRDEALYRLIDRIEHSNFTYFEWKEGDQALVLSKDQGPHSNQTSFNREPFLESGIQKKDSEKVQVMEKEEGQGLETGGKLETVKSPIVGVAYLKPNPSASVFVNQGDRIEVGQTLFIVEAMKLMNEITSPVKGIVKSIQVENEEVVEFDQVLFEVMVD